MVIIMMMMTKIKDKDIFIDNGVTITLLTMDNG